MRIGIDISVLGNKQKTGIAVYVYNLIDNLLKINKKDRFILFGFASFADYDYLRNIEFKKYPNVEIKIIRLPIKLFRLIFLFWQKFGFPKIEQITGPVDIFHSFNWFLPPQKNGKIIATVFDMTPMLFPRFHQDKTIQLDQIRMERIKKKADLVTTISENSKMDFLKFAHNKKVEIIYPGINDNFLIDVSKSKTEKVLKKYKLEKGYILCVSTLEPRKNIEFLIKSYLKSRIERKLILVGISGWKNSGILNLIDNHKDKIISLGFVDSEDLLSIYRQAICFVYPTLYEGFGLPIIESFIAKTPVIASANSSLKEVGGEAIFYINENDEKSLIKALKEVINNKSLQDHLIAAGLKQAANFSWEKSAKKLNSLYEHIY